ncbi:hypothetical protein HDU97_004742 [Phlyctochytrium planicorne]|nr:hypothetical protein HDU97_004742 [Phlyctochytrium planicorne]
MQLSLLISSAFIAMSSMAASQSQTDPKPCAIFCPPTTNAFVCGNDGKTYPSECELTNASCNNPKLKKSSDGACASDPKPCAIFCPIVANAYVCGTDGVTYASECALMNAACNKPDLKKAFDAACACALSCTVPSGADHPLCGTDGVTYPNSCAFGDAVCKNPLLKRASDGTCPDVSTASTDASTSTSTATSTVTYITVTTTTKTETVSYTTLAPTSTAVETKEYVPTSVTKTGVYVSGSSLNVELSAILVAATVAFAALNL